MTDGGCQQHPQFFFCAHSTTLMSVWLKTTRSLRTFSASIYNNRVIPISSLHFYQTLHNVVPAAGTTKIPDEIVQRDFIGKRLLEPIVHLSLPGKFSNRRRLVFLPCRRVHDTSQKVDSRKICPTMLLWIVDNQSIFVQHTKQNH